MGEEAERRHQHALLLRVGGRHHAQQEGAERVPLVVIQQSEEDVATHQFVQEEEPFVVAAAAQLQPVAEPSLQILQRGKADERTLGSRVRDRRHLADQSVDHSLRDARAVVDAVEGGHRRRRRQGHGELNVRGGGELPCAGGAQRFENLDASLEESHRGRRLGGGEGAVEQLSFVGGREAARERDVRSLGGVPSELLAEPPRQSVVHRRVKRGEGEAEAARVGVGVLVFRSVGEGADELRLLGGEGRVRDAQGGDARGGVVLAGEEAEEEEVEGGADRRARYEGVRDVHGIEVVAAPPERLEPAAVAAAQVHLRREGLPPPIGLAEPPLADALPLRPRRRRHQHVQAAALPLQ